MEVMKRREGSWSDEEVGGGGEDEKLGEEKWPIKGMSLMRLVPEVGSRIGYGH